MHVSHHRTRSFKMFVKHLCPTGATDLLSNIDHLRIDVNQCIKFEVYGANLSPFKGWETNIPFGLLSYPLVQSKMPLLL